MQQPKFGPPPTKAELDALRAAAIKRQAEADRAWKAYYEGIERVRFDVEEKTSFLFKQQMQQRPTGGIA